MASFKHAVALLGISVPSEDVTVIPKPKGPRGGRLSRKGSVPSEFSIRIYHPNPYMGYLVRVPLSSSNGNATRALEICPPSLAQTKIESWRLLPRGIRAG